MILKDRAGNVYGVHFYYYSTVSDPPDRLTSVTIHVGPCDRPAPDQRCRLIGASPAHQVYQATTRCSKSDQFCRAIGSKLAFERAVQKLIEGLTGQPAGSHSPPGARDLRTDLWKGYWEKRKYPPKPNMKKPEPEYVWDGR